MNAKQRTKTTHWRTFSTPYSLEKCLSRLKSGERNGYQIELLYENAYAYHFRVMNGQAFTPQLTGKLESNTAYSTYITINLPDYWRNYRPHMVLLAIGSLVAIIGGFGVIDFAIWGMLGMIMLYDYLGRLALLQAIKEVLHPHPAYQVPPVHHLPT